MKLKWLMILGLMIFCLFSQKGIAEALSGSDLLNYCEKNGAFQHGYCYGFIEGVVEYNYLAEKVLLDKQIIKSNKVCIGPQVPLEQAVKKVEEYLRNNSGKLHETAANLVILAAEKYFPCPQ